MCFSATASFVAGGSLSVIGGVTLKKAKMNSEKPFASIPLLFGLQQIIEGGVWLSFASPEWNQIMNFAYSMFSHVLWPIFVPFAVWLMESDPYRKKVLRFFLFLGLAIGLYLLYFLIKIPVISEVVEHSISYSSYNPYPIVSTLLYVMSTCISCLFSSHKWVNIFGFTLFVSFFIAYFFYTAAFFSVWCFFSAILSLMVYLHFSKKQVNGKVTL